MKPDHFPDGRPASSSSCPVSIVIKALNEEKRIASTIEKALQAASAVGGEISVHDDHERLGEPNGLEDRVCWPTSCREKRS